MSELFKRGIVRIFRPDGTDKGKTLGTGFVAHQDGLLLTCAHVLEKEPGVPEGAKTVSIEFYSDGSAATAKVIPKYWRPSTGEDVAVLQLEPLVGLSISALVVSESSEEVMAAKQPLVLPLGYSDHIRKAPFSKVVRLGTFGFPKQKPFTYVGSPGICEITGTIKDNGFEVFANRSKEVTYGFSGSPVWDDELDAVVGMNVSIVKPGSDEGGRNSETAFFIPVETLRSVCDKLALPEGEPYRNLDEFEEKHEQFYFGRETASAQMVDLLGSNDIVAVVGISGSGKSSLVGAGLLKGLKAANSPLLDRPRVRFRADAEPLLAMLTALEKSLPAETTKFAESLGFTAASDRKEAAKHLCEIPTKQIVQALQTLGKTNPIILVCDQFERLYTDRAKDDVREKFISIFISCACQEIKILFATRADYYYSRVHGERALAKTVGKAEMLLRPMSPEDLRSAITNPARNLFRYFDIRIVGELANEVSDRPGDLPLLQFALTELWKADNQKGVITYKSYQELGEVDDQGKVIIPGARGAIVRRANEYYRKLQNNEERERCKRLFHLLVNTTSAASTNPGPDVGRRALASELDERTLVLANRLADTFLLTAREDPLTRQRTFEVAHEALLRSWPLLRNWDEDEQSWSVWYQTVLSPAFNEWLARKRSPDSLIRSKAILAEAERWLAREAVDGDSDIHQYAQTCIVRARRRSQVQKAIGSFVAVALVLITTWALLSQRQADRAATAARTSARDALTSSAITRLDRGETFGAMQEFAAAIHSVEDQQILQTVNRVRLRFATQTTPRLLAIIAQTNGPGSVLFTADVSKLITTDRAGMALLWDVRSITNGGIATPIFLDKCRTDYPLTLLSGDGGTLITATTEGTLRVWDASTMKQVSNIAGPALSHLGDPSGFVMDDIIDLGLFATNLTRQERPVDQWLASRLSGATRAELISYMRSGEERESLTLDLLRDLNAVIRKESIFQEERFAGVSLGEETKRLILEEPGNKKLLFLNYRLLEDAYIGQLLRANLSMLSLTSDGSKLVTACVRAKSAHVWDTKTGRLLFSLAIPEDQSWFEALVFDPTGNYLAGSTADGLTMIWDAKTGDNYAFVRDKAQVFWAAFRPNSMELATSTAEGSVTLWDYSRRENGPHIAAEGVEIRRFPGFAEIVNRVVFDPSGSRLLALSRGDNPRVWTPDGNLPNAAIVFPLRSRASRGPSNAFPLEGVFSKDGSRVLTWQGNTVTCWDAATGRSVWTIQGHAGGEMTGHITSAAMSANGEFVATASGDKTVRLWRVPGPLDSCIEKYDVASIRASAQDFSDELLQRNVSWMKQNGRLASASSVQAAKKLRAEENIPLKSTSPDGRLKIIAESDISLKVVDTKTGETNSTLDGHQNVIHGAGFDHSGHWIATFAGDNTVRVWSSGQNGRFSLSSVFTQEGLSSVDFSRSGGLLATASYDDNSVLVWDLSEASVVARIIGSSGSRSSSAFDDNGRLLAGFWNDENRHADYQSNNTTYIHIIPDDRSISVWETKPLDIAADIITNWVEVYTGTVWNPRQPGGVEGLSEQEWSARRARLERMLGASGTEGTGF